MTATPPAADGLGDRLVRALSGARDARAAGATVLRELAASTGAPLAALWLLDPADGLLALGEDHAEGDAHAEVRRVARRLTFAPGAGLPGRVLDTLQPAWVEDIGDEHGEFPRAEVALRSGLRSAVAAPLTSDDGVHGVLELLHERTGRPAPEELADLTLAARQLGAFLGRLGVEERLQAAEESSASIFQAALDAIITMDHRGRVLDLNPAAETAFGLVRDEVVGERLAELVIPPDLREAHERALERYVRDRRPTILGRRLELAALRADGTAFPVELTVTRLGRREPPVFAGFVRDLTGRRALEAEQSRLLREALSARAQAEAANVRTDEALREAERGRERMAVLAAAVEAMTEAMDFDAALQAVVRSAVPTVADAAHLVLGHRGRVRPGASAGPLPADAALAERVLRSGRAEQPSGRCACVPLRTPDGVVGALTFLAGQARGAFAEEDLTLMTGLADRAALHLENARLYTERSHIAHTLQAGLRPRALPEVPGVDLAARFVPVGGAGGVGGDFYDVFRSGDGRWTAVVGDVAGKGPEAAAVTALARHTLRTASLLDDDPAANVGLLNRVLHDEAAWPLDLCTVVCAGLYPAGDGLALRCASGAHPTPLLVRRDGTVEDAGVARGPLVGAFRAAAYPASRLRLEPGELLLFYTDGVTEVRTSDVGLGERELRAVLAEHAGAPADAVVDAVQRRAVALQDGPQRDDIALLAIRAAG